MHQEDGEDKGGRAPYFKFFTDDWAGGVQGLTIEQEGFFLRFVRLQWSRKKPTLPDDIKQLSVVMHVDPRTVRRLRAHLIEMGKLISRDGSLWNPRAKRDIENHLRRTSAEDRAEIGRRSAEDRPKIEAKKSENPTKSTVGVRDEFHPYPDPSSDPEREERSSLVRLIDDDDRGSTDPPQRRKISKAVETALCNREGQERGTAIIAEYLGSDYAKNARVIDRAFVGWLKNTYGIEISVRGAAAPIADIIAMCGIDKHGRPDLALPKRVRGRS